MESGFPDVFFIYSLHSFYSKLKDDLCWCCGQTSWFPRSWRVLDTLIYILRQHHLRRHSSAPIHSLTDKSTRTLTECLPVIGFPSPAGSLCGPSFGLVWLVASSPSDLANFDVAVLFKDSGTISSTVIDDLGSRTSCKKNPFMNSRVYIYSRVPEIRITVFLLKIYIESDISFQFFLRLHRRACQLFFLFVC